MLNAQRVHVSTSSWFPKYDPDPRNWIVQGGAPPFLSRLDTGWWYTYPSEKYEFVSWDDDIPNICEKMFQTTNQDIYID